MKKHSMLFSMRYADLLKSENNIHKNDFCTDLSYDVQVDIEKIMFNFDEPIRYNPNRYDNFQVTTSALEIAIEDFNDATRSSITLDYNNISLAALPTKFLFDIIELQYVELSDGEKCDFQYEINMIFQQCDLPWLLSNGRMIKIDSTQFECDLQRKTLELIHELKDAEPKFKSAYNELTTAIEDLNKGDFQSAINNAGKSYESVLKVILNADRGNADKLTNQYMDNFLKVPETMTMTGFREKVMMSLPFIRNNSGADHGAGAKDVIISKTMAKLAVNLAAALNTYLIEEYQAKLVSNDQGKQLEAENGKSDFPF